MSKKLLPKGLWVLLALCLVGAMCVLLTMAPASPGKVDEVSEASPSVAGEQASGPATSYADSANEEDFSLWGLVLDLGMKLLIVVGLAYITIRLWKRAMVAKGSLPQGRSLIRVLELNHLGQHQTLYLVRVGEKTLLLGATTSQVTLLSEMSDAMPLSAEEEQQSRQGATDRFTQYLKLADERMSFWPWRTKITAVPKAILSCVQGHTTLG
ncbi:MAG: flagellar biosynthetic protein FliO [Chloroflexota bacterium]